MIVEVILQLLICIVDTELLKAVDLKVLKAKNVQDANRQTLKNHEHHMNTREEHEGEHSTVISQRIIMFAEFYNVQMH